MGMAYNEIDILFVTMDGEKHYYDCGLPDEMQAELTDTTLFTKATSIDDIINGIGYGLVDSWYENEGENYFDAMFDDAKYWYYSDKPEQLQFSDIKTIILMTNKQLTDLDRSYHWVLYDLKNKRRRSGSVTAKRDPESDSFYGEICDVDPMPKDFLESLRGPLIDRIQVEKSKTSVPLSSYKLAGDRDFIEDSLCYKYIGPHEYVIIPDQIQGETIVEYFKMFSGNVKGVASFNKNVTDMAFMFYKAKGLMELDLSHLDTSSVENMNKMFSECSGIKSLDLSSFDTFDVTDMKEMFQDSADLVSINLSSFYVSEVEHMRGMFRGCRSLESLDLSHFKTSSAIWMHSMFMDCSNLKTLDISNFDTSKTDMLFAMFRNCSSLKTLDLSSFDTSKVKDMRYMFHGCNSLTSVDLSSFDTSSVTDTHSMFCDCSSLKALDISNFDTSKIDMLFAMFRNCSSLKTLDLSSFDTSSVTSMANMFQNCNSLATLDLSSFDTSKVEEMNNMFDGCSSLTILDLSSFDMSCLSLSGEMFYGCSSLETVYFRTEDDAKKVASTGGITEDIPRGINFVNKATGEIFATSGAPQVSDASDSDKGNRNPVSNSDHSKTSVNQEKSDSELWLDEFGAYVEVEPHIDFDEKLFVFTGLTKSHDAVKQVLAKGGVYRSSISSKTDYLIVNPDNAGKTKISAAIEQKKKGSLIKVILLEDLLPSTTGK